MQSPNESLLNPYESPKADTSLIGPGIGVWRQGNLVVMHFDAELQRVCINTGAEAAGAREHRLIWRPPGGVLTREKNLWLPLCRAHLEAYRRSRIISLVGPMLSACCILFMFVVSKLWRGMDDRMIFIFGPALILAIIGVVMWLVTYFQNWKPLRVVGAKDDYLWLAVHPRVASGLPEWPGDYQN